MVFTVSCYEQGHISVICGLPDMGKVCEEHVRGYIDMADALKDEGVKKVAIMAVDKASVIDSWLKDKYGDACSGIEAVGDETGAFTRMLGVNINDPERPQKTQRCLRFSGCCTSTFHRCGRQRTSPSFAFQRTHAMSSLHKLVLMPLSDNAGSPP